jgi:hypothetical protein
MFNVGHVFLFNDSLASRHLRRRPSLNFLVFVQFFLYISNEPGNARISFCGLRVVQ